MALASLLIAIALAASVTIVVRRQRLVCRAVQEAEAKVMGRTVALPSIYQQVMERSRPPLNPEGASPADGQETAGDKDPAAPLGSLAWLSAAGEAVWTGADLWHHFAQINSDFYQAVSHLAGEQLSTISDLHHYLSGYDHGLLGDLPEGTVNMLQGHLAEQVVADHLTAQGHNVVFAEHANQADWDLLVDGQPFNVKDITDVANLTEHLQAHPDIPLIVPEHANGLTDDIPSIDASVLGDHAVLTDHLLDHDAIVEQAQGGAEAALGHVDAHFPFITLALSAGREIRLLRDHKTEIERSLRNIALDAAGTGFGNTIGGTVGGLLGSIIPGPGTLIGATAGALAGGIAGRLGTNLIKRAPLRKAHAAYKGAHAQLTSEMVSAVRAAEQAYTSAVDDEERSLRARAAAGKAGIQEAVKHAEEQLLLAAHLPGPSAAALVGQAEETLQSELEACRQRLQQVSVWRRYIWPDAAAGEAVACVRVAAARLDRFRGLAARFTSAPPAQDLSGDDAHQLFEVLLSFGCAESHVRQYLHQIERTRDEQQAAVQACVANVRMGLVQARDGAAERLSALLAKLKDDTKQALTPFVEALGQAEKEYRRELERNGIRLDTPAQSGG